MAKTRPLDAIEIRVLGALMEKELSTPDHYPLTIKGALAATNQKSNRHPPMSLNETQVVEALDRMRQDALAWRSEGIRAERWEHLLDRRWQLNTASKAVMAELMLRGPQSPGELKTRCERMHHFATREDAEEVLKGLAEGFDALVRELPRVPGQRDNRWMHLVAAEGADGGEGLEAGEVHEAPRVARAAAPKASEPPPPSGPAPRERLDRLEEAVAELGEELRSLRIRLGDLDE